MRAGRVLLSLVAAALAACSSTATTPVATNTPTPTTATTPSPAAPIPAAPCGWPDVKPIKHVVWIWMENRSYDDVLKNDHQAPRLSSYARACGLATNYRAITHPSLPNYLAATSGSTGGVTSDCSPSQCPQYRTSIFAQLDRAGIEWRTYAEAMPTPCNTSAQGRYATKHNPAVYFPSIRDRCKTWDLPMSRARFDRLPAFTFIEPDICNDGHDCPTAHADAWLGAMLDRITHSPSYRKGGDIAVFVTWDEGIGADQHIATVVISPGVRRGTRSSTPYTHYSLLRTTETLLGLTPLGHARAATDMSTAFGLR